MSKIGQNREKIGEAIRIFKVKGGSYKDFWPEYIPLNFYLRGKCEYSGLNIPPPIFLKILGFPNFSILNQRSDQFYNITLVRAYIVRQELISETAPRIFPKLGMKLGDNIRVKK